MDELEKNALTRVGSAIQGKYHLDRLLGVGGMAAVYAATHRNGHRVAIKILHRELVRDEHTHRLFRREAQIANRVGHPGAVGVIDDDLTEDGCGFLVMPLLQGETLRRRWERKGKRLEVREVALLAMSVLDVLAAAHANKIVHRDVKPENLFLTCDGSIRVLDFGIARLLESSDGPTATLSGHAIGTPAYMAPEQALGRAHLIDARTDLWAMGATMFTLITGCNVHEGETPSELVVYVATRPARRVTSVAPDVPGVIASVIDRALELDRRNRWSTAVEMHEALSAACESLYRDSMQSLAQFVAKHDPPASLVDEPFDVHALETKRVARPSVSADASGDGTSHTSHPPKTRADVGGRALSAGAMLDGVARVGTWRQRARLPVFRAFVLMALVAASVAVVVIVRGGFRRSGIRLAAGVETKASSAPSASSITENLEALKAYHEALQDWRAANASRARQKLDQAVALDPSFGAAALYRALLDFWPNQLTRENFRRALERSQRFTKPQLALLKAYEPALALAPDYALAEKALFDAHAGFPEDVTILMMLAQAQMRAGHPRAALDTLDSLDALDQNSARTHHMKATAFSLMSESERVRTSLLRCVELNPTAEQCLLQLALLEEIEGNCGEAERHARVEVQGTAPNPLVLQTLANALYATGANEARLQSALNRHLGVLPKEEREAFSLELGFNIKVLDGDFQGAERIVTEWSQVVGPRRYQLDHYSQTKSEMYLRLETGSFLKANELAETFTVRLRAWLPDPFEDYEILPLRIQYLTGKFGRQKFLRSREDWLSRDVNVHGGVVGTSITRWQVAYAEAIATKTDAEDALRALPNYLPLPSTFLADAQFQNAIGYAYLRAGRTDEALSYLQRGAKSCMALQYPFEQTWAILHYGMALEQSNAPDACLEYEKVLARWGRVQDSISARMARSGMKRLACAGH